MAGERRALVIGGSMSGLFAAILLRRAGWQADALGRFESARTDINRRVLQRGRGLGTYLTPHPATAEARAKAEQHRTSAAMMAEIAVLDFLRA
jgi:monoamine oxidase